MLADDNKKMRFMLGLNLVMNLMQIGSLETKRLIRKEIKMMRIALLAKGSDETISKYSAHLCYLI